MGESGEGSAKYARTTGSYRKGLFKNYTCDSQRIKTHISNEGEGVRGCTHAQDRTDREANTEGSLRSSLSPSSETTLNN